MKSEKNNKKHSQKYDKLQLGLMSSLDKQKFWDKLAIIRLGKSGKNGVKITNGKETLEVS